MLEGTKTSKNVCINSSSVYFSQSNIVLLMLYKWFHLNYIVTQKTKLIKHYNKNVF